MYSINTHNCPSDASYVLPRPPTRARLTDQASLKRQGSPNPPSHKSPHPTLVPIAFRTSAIAQPQAQARHTILRLRLLGAWSHSQYLIVPQQPPSPPQQSFLATHLRKLSAQRRKLTTQLCILIAHTLILIYGH